MMSDYLGPYLLGPNDENQGIYTGDARELVEAIPDESVDLIFTDPMYQNIEDYRWLAEMAVRILKPNRALLTWFAVGELPKVLNALQVNGLIYRWLLEFSLIGTPLYYGQIGVKSQKCLWLDKGNTKLSKMILDVTTINAYRRPNNGSVKCWHDSDRGGAKLKNNLTDWGKDVAGTARFIDAFTDSGATILDPFTGGGTVPAVCKASGRRWLAFEIDPITAERARERMNMTQAPLFTLQPEQASFYLA